MSHVIFEIIRFVLLVWSTCVFCHANPLKAPGHDDVEKFDSLAKYDTKKKIVADPILNDNSQTILAAENAAQRRNSDEAGFPLAAPNYLNFLAVHDRKIRQQPPGRLSQDASVDDNGNTETVQKIRPSIGTAIVIGVLCFLISVGGSVLIYLLLKYDAEEAEEIAGQILADHFLPLDFQSQASMLSTMSHQEEPAEERPESAHEVSVQASLATDGSLLEEQLSSLLTSDTLSTRTD